MEDARDAPSPNRVLEFFHDKTILITGGTGFVGKVLIEKLLRCCSPKKIYVVIRPKNGKSAQQRLQKVLGGPLFKLVKADHDKVEAISGDISAEDLGLSSEDRERLAEETEIVYHSAATTKFDEPLKSAVFSNVRGTRLMLELAKECKKLIVFSYISTAYCHTDQNELLERFYPTTVDPDLVIKLVEWMRDDCLKIITKCLLGKSVNNYTFSKALGEALVEKELDHLPVIIQRPSVVLPIWKEPIPGWADKMNAPVSLLIGVGKGLIRTMYVRKNQFVDCVPVDITANSLILSAYHFYTFRSCRVYNLTASDENVSSGITIKRIVEMGKTIFSERVAFSPVLWYPYGSLKKSKLSHYLAFLLFQLLPALLIDPILFITGARPFLLKAQKKIWKGYKELEYFSNREWKFINENSLTSRRVLNFTERRMFNVGQRVNALDYMTQCALYCRCNILKESDDSDVSLRRMKMLRYVDHICKSVLVLGILYLVLSALMNA